MAELTTVVLEVDPEKAPGLVEALGKRPYINIVELTRAERKARKQCPCCAQRFAREVTYAVTEDVLDGLLAMLVGMKVSKSVILINKKTSGVDSLPEYERARCVDFDHNALKRAETLGLVKQFQDGSRLTYFATAAAIEFLGGKIPLSPSEAIVVGSDVIDRFGETMLDDVKFKDRVRKDRLQKDLRKAIAGLSKAVLEFVEKGQMSLVE